MGPGIRATIPRKWNSLCSCGRQLVIMSRTKFLTTGCARPAAGKAAEIQRGQRDIVMIVQN